MSNLHKLVSISCILSIFTSCTDKVSEDFIKDIRFDKAQINVTDFFEDKKVKLLKSTLALRSDDKSILRITSEVVTSTEEARKIMIQKSNEIQLLFAPQQVPYMGQITKDIKCTEAVEISNKAVETEKEISLITNLTATERLIYGSCIPEQETYNSQLLLLYCKSSKTLHEIKYFYSKSQPYKKKIANCL